MKSIIDFLLNTSAVFGILALIAGKTALIVFIFRNIICLLKIEFCGYIPSVSISLSTNGVGKRQAYFKLESNTLTKKYSNIRSLEFVEYLGNPV
jgi:hypothetical protein